MRRKYGRVRESGTWLCEIGGDLRTNQESTGAGRCHTHDAFHGTGSSYGAAGDANYIFQVSTANAIGITEYQDFPLRNVGYGRRVAIETFSDSMEIDAVVGIGIVELLMEEGEGVGGLGNKEKGFATPLRRMGKWLRLGARGCKPLLLTVTPAGRGVRRSWSVRARGLWRRGGIAGRSIPGRGRAFRLWRERPGWSCRRGGCARHCGCR